MPDLGYFDLNKNKFIDKYYTGEQGNTLILYTRRLNLSFDFAVLYSTQVDISGVWVGA
jgi:hypothetical protein